jgi:hypothetical protein
MTAARMSLRVAASPMAGGFCGGCDQMEPGEAAGQAAMGPQTLIWALAVAVARCGLPGGKLVRALVFRSRCRFRSVSPRRRARSARMASRLAPVSAAGRLAVAAPERVEVMTARRAA